MIHVNIKIGKVTNDVYTLYGELDNKQNFDIHTIFNDTNKSIEIYIFLPSETIICNIKIQEEIDKSKSYIAISKNTGRGTFLVLLISYDKFTEVLEKRKVEFSQKCCVFNE